MDLKLLHEQRAKALADRETLLAKADFSDEDGKRDDELGKEIEALNAKIARVEAFETEKAREFAKVNPKPTKATNPVSSTTDTIEVSEPGFVKDPKKGFDTPAQFLTAVIETNAQGRVSDERLKYLQFDPKATQGSDENMVSSDPYGGFTLPEGFSPNLLTIADEADPFAGRTTMVPMQVPTVNIPARVDSNHSTSVAGGVTVSRTAETTDATATRIEFENVRLEAHELVGASYATEQLLRYSPLSFTTILAQSFGSAFAGKRVDEIINGNGTDEFEGIVAAGCTVEQAAEGSQTAATLKYENVIKMRSRCWGYDGAVWVANHDTLPELMTIAFTSSAIAPIWQPSAREDRPDMLLGRPIFFSEYAATLGTVGDILLANMSQYLEGVLQPLESAESIHVRFLARERTFRFVRMDAGAPWWRTKLTPAKSSTTLSPFVTLATRA